MLTLTTPRRRLSLHDSNAKYQDSPQQMMTARGQAEICRQIAPDALHGIPYAVEEIEEFAPEIPATPRVTAAEITAEDEFADLDSDDEPADVPASPDGQVQ